MAIDESTPIIIYQMGKVGSTALYLSIRGHFENVYQVHSLHPKKLAKTSKILNEKGLGIPRHVKDSLNIVDNIIKPGVKAKIITPIRHPLDRNISAFFQELSTQLIINNEFRRNLGISDSIKWVTKLPLTNEIKNSIVSHLTQGKLSKNVALLQKHFIDNYRHRIPLDWFDDEFKGALDMCVYTTGFNKTNGYMRFSNGVFDVLIYKAELDHSIKNDLIAKFLSIESLFIPRVHASTFKNYGKLMKEFQLSLQLPEDVRRVYNQSRYKQTFYG